MIEISKEQEEEAKREYLLIIDALKEAPEFENEWTGSWDDFIPDGQKVAFGSKPTKVKGDREKFIKNYLANKESLLNFY